jgi:hypothetical protein
MSDPIVAFEVLMDAIAQGVQDGLRIWLMLVVAAVMVVIAAVWLIERIARRSGK